MFTIIIWISSHASTCDRIPCIISFIYELFQLFLKFTFILLIYKICYKSNNPICYAPIFANLLFPLIKLDYLERSRISILYRSANLTCWSKFVGLQLRPISNSAVFLWFTTSIATCWSIQNIINQRIKVLFTAHHNLRTYWFFLWNLWIYDIPYIIESRCYLLYIGIYKLTTSCNKNFEFYILYKIITAFSRSNNSTRIS